MQTFPHSLVYTQIHDKYDGEHSLTNLKWRPNGHGELRGQARDIKLIGVYQDDTKRMYQEKGL